MEKKENKNWQLYLSRPFTLFGASLWHQWYASELCKEIFGVNIQNGLLIENPKGVVRYYRKKDEEEELFKGFDNLALKSAEGKLEPLLNEALMLNKEAEIMLEKGTNYDLKSLVDFFIRLSLLSTVLPFRVGEAAFKNKNDKKILDLVEKLRRVSYYPKIMDKLITPLVQKELEARGIFDKDAANFVTFDELTGNKEVNIKERILQSQDEKTFIYENLNGREDVIFTDNPMSLIKEIENIKTGESEIRGQAAFRGIAKGVVKLVLTNKISDIQFEKGNILVAISTSPELMPIIKKCGAIVTDEGGITCHAAVISRELKIPCIVGTKIATKFLKDGDIVQVNANHGFVRILERAK